MAAGNPKAELDIERAMLDPSAVFATPEEVLTHPGLTRDQRIEILRRWHYDATDIAVAVEEGMPGGEETMLRRITLALEKVAGPVDPDQTGASKQHGLTRDAIAPKR